MTSESNTDNDGERRQDPMLSTPSESDRRRFLGCLASVLATAYPIHGDGRKDAATTNKSDLGGDEQEDDDNRSVATTSSSVASVSSSAVRRFSSVRSSSSGTGTDEGGKRHCERRHELFSQLLVMSAVWLQLAAQDGEAFVPLLDQLRNEGEGKSRGKEDNDDSVTLPFLGSTEAAHGVLQCLVIVLLQYLLHSSEQGGYDARVRHALKRIAVVLWLYDKDRNETWEADETTNVVSENDENKWDRIERATIKFELLERYIATRLLQLADTAKQSASSSSSSTTVTTSSSTTSSRGKSSLLSRRNVVRGLKVGGAGVVAGTLLAVTGGMAAPAIAAAVGTLAAHTVVAGTVTALTTTTAVTAIFGVGGGGLAAHKMSRRTQGLTEFGFWKHPSPLPAASDASAADTGKQPQEGNDARSPEADLHTTICVSGWIRERLDFQRPWGVEPLQDKLSRFFTENDPPQVEEAATIAGVWREREMELWSLLKAQYDHVDVEGYTTPRDGVLLGASLTEEEYDFVDAIMGVRPSKDDARPTGDENETKGEQPGRHGPVLPSTGRKGNSLFSKGRKEMSTQLTKIGNTTSSQMTKIGNTTSSQLSKLGSTTSKLGNKTMQQLSLKKGLGNAQNAQSAASTEDDAGATVPSNAGEKTPEDVESDSSGGKSPSGGKDKEELWDFHSTFGSELYTLQWESKALMEWRSSYVSFASNVLQQQVTVNVLKRTLLGGLMAAVAVPATVWTAAGVIDGPWTLAVEKADAAGVELARALLHDHNRKNNGSGRRPVTLVGASMGARVVYACLRELSKQQVKWEQQQQQQSKSMKKDKSTAPIQKAHTQGEKLNESSEEDDDDSDGEEELLSREPASIVEDAILMGTPVRVRKASWASCRRMVAGRLVHCYSKRDWILLLMFQLRNQSASDKVQGHLPVAATNPIAGVESVDVSDLISSHSDYQSKAGTILRRVVHLGQPVYHTKQGVPTA